MWIKEIDGVVTAYAGPKITAEEMTAAGWSVGELPEIIQPAAPIIYSKYKIVCTLGDRWPALRAQIDAAGLGDLWDAATELSSDDPNFAAFLAGLSDADLLLLSNCIKD